MQKAEYVNSLRLEFKRYVSTFELQDLDSVKFSKITKTFNVFVDSPIWQWYFLIIIKLFSEAFLNNNIANGYPHIATKG